MRVARYGDDSHSKRVAELMAAIDKARSMYADAGLLIEHGSETKDAFECSKNTRGCNVTYTLTSTGRVEVVTIPVTASAGWNIYGSFPQHPAYVLTTTAYFMRIPRQVVDIHKLDGVLYFPDDKCPINKQDFTQRDLEVKAKETLVSLHKEWNPDGEVYNAIIDAVFEADNKFRKLR